MAGGLPRTNSAIRLEVKSWVTVTEFWLALNLATRLLKYGTTSGFVSSKTMRVRPPEEEHPAARPGTASAAAPRPTVFIIVRRLMPAEASVPAALRAAVSLGLPDRALLTRRMPTPFDRERPSNQARLLG